MNILEYCQKCERKESEADLDCIECLQNEIMKLGDINRPTYFKEVS